MEILFLFLIGKLDFIDQKSKYTGYIQEQCLECLFTRYKEFME